MFVDLKPKAVKRRFRSRIAQLVWQIVGGGRKTPPPPSAGRVWEYPTGARFNTRTAVGGGRISLKTRSNIDAKLSVLFPASVLRIVSKFQGKNPSINILRKLRFSDVIFRQSG